MPTGEHYELYFRINGQLVLEQTEEHVWGKRLIAYFKFLADMDVGERRRPQAGACSYTLKDETLELRFSTITNVYLLESLVIRLLGRSGEIQRELALFFPQQLSKLSELIRRKSGLLLFSGPVGSGKTTTIYYLLRQRMQEEMIQVITMEDPVEIYEEKFLQTEVNEKAGINYDLLIKSSLRHHPDILMIGEIRDDETAKMVIRAALTGHLVVGTIHAKNCLGVIGRLQELGVTDQQLSQTLIGIISQRLLPIYCPYCQGDCLPTCQERLQTHKRSALLEILSGEALHNVFEAEKTLSYTPFNTYLRKALAYGYISLQAYQKFEIV